MPKPDWLPNWENESEYPSPDDTIPFKYWAWEFLKRNPEFQKDIDIFTDHFFEVQWSNFLKFIETSPDKFRDYASESDVDGINLDITNYIASIYTGYFHDKYDSRYFEVYDKNYYYNVLRKHGVFLIDHYKSNFPLIIFNSEIIKNPELSVFYNIRTFFDKNEESNRDDMHLLQYFDVPMMSYKNRGSVKLTFDTNNNFDEHFESIKRHIVRFNEDIKKWENSKKVKLIKRVRKDKLRTYLRVLDGKVSGTTNLEIAEKLIPNLNSSDPDYKIKTIDKYYKAAKRIMHGGYYSLAAMEDSRTIFRSTHKL